MNIVGIAGSLRRASYNAALLRAAVDLAPAGLTIAVESIREIPLYDGDLETAAFPPAVTVLKEKIAASDGLLLVTPEYNWSIPGVFKNAIDWCSRPPKDIPRVFGGKPVVVIGATPGRGGTRLSQSAWLDVLRALELRPYFGKTLFLAEARKMFDDQLRLTDEPTRAQLRAVLEGFVAFAAK
jgi:chromate reductase, NAD(P)H dehydrogenase (quinone)